MTIDEQIILVNSQDQEIGLMEKLEAHEKGILHRAFSVFLFNDKDELLLQQRAFSKYHCGGLWTNTCCSHQRQGETNIAAANRRLTDELGITARSLMEVYEFTYQAHFENGLTEHEYDHVLIGKYNELPTGNPAEVAHTQFLSIQEINEKIKTNPAEFTPWFKLIFEKIAEIYLQKKDSL